LFINVIFSTFLKLCTFLSHYAADDSGSEADDHQTVWNHSSTRPFDAVDAVSSTEAARLTDDQVRLIGDLTLDGGSAPDKLTSMLRETAKHYVYRELHRFAADVVPALFDVLTARQ